MTLRWTLPWVVSSGSHFPMSVWFLYGVISGSWILTSSFRRSAYQICYVSPWSYSWVIRTYQVHLMPHWGIFPHSAMETIALSLICYSFHHSTERCHICFMGHYSDDFHRDELSLEHSMRFDCSISLVDRSLRLRESLLDHSIGSRVVMTRYTRAYSPPSFPCSSAFRASVTS